MKKKILLILTFIISFILYTNTVSAATELTCVYGKKASKQPAVKIVQYNDGTKKVSVNTKEDYPSADSENWWLASNVEFESNEELTSCPQYMDYKGGAHRTVIFSSTAQSGYAKLSSSKNGIEDKYNSATDPDYVKGEKSNMEDEIASGKWILGCQYKKINEDKYVYLYFNESKVRVVKGDEVLQICGAEDKNFVLCSGEVSDIQVSRVLKEYSTNGGCPINIYRNQFTSGINQGSVVYSLDRLTNASNMTTYIYIKGSDTKPEPTPVDPTDCNQLLGEDVINFINEIMKWIRIFVPILLIGLGILDFTKATFSKTEDDMKKAREKFIKRIIAAVLVFLVPIFVNLLLELANSVWGWINPETCIK